MSNDSTVIPHRSELISHFLAKPAELPRDEPAIAANIHEQLQHMGLSTWSISVIRRVRDALYRINPDNLLEVGGSIGHRSAWLLDLFDNHSRPNQYDIVEQGNKFAVIIKRLVDRYNAASWTNIKVGELQTLAAETVAWQAATVTGLEPNDAPLKTDYDVIIVDEKPESLAKSIESCLQLLSPNGVLITTEPLVPSGEVDETDEAQMALVNGFNNLIELIKSSQNDYYVAFIPVFEGTIVGFLHK